MDKKKLIRLIICIVLTLIAWCVPAEWFGIEGLTVVEQRVIALFIFAASMWITEPVPIWTTSVFLMVLMLLTTSSSMVVLFRPDGVLPKNAIDYKAIMAAFADPTIMLFLGGRCGPFRQPFIASGACLELRLQRQRGELVELTDNHLECRSR